MTVVPDNFELRLNRHAQRLLKTHETLLRDRVRNAAFYEALRRNVKRGDLVLDIGAGTGIWAIAAAKLGAKRVVAIDGDELMVGVIRMLATEHGVADRVEAIWGNSFDINLRREYDVVVSETIGYLGYDENIVAVMRDARERFLKVGGAMIPETVSLYAAAGRLKVRKAVVPEAVPLEFNELAKLSLNSPRALKRSSDLKLLTKAQRLVGTDLRKATERPSLENLTASWEVGDTSEIDCFTLWVESRLTRGVRLSTRRTTSWLPTVFPVARPEGSFNKVEFDVSLTPESVSWEAAFSDGKRVIKRRYAPEIAATAMIAAARLPGQVVQLDEGIFLEPSGK